MKKIIFISILLFSYRIYTMDTPPKSNKKLSFIYSPDYDITFWGIEQKLHPFDSTKYSKVANYLMEKKLVKKEDFITPQEITDEQLKKVHTEEYLNDLQNNSAVMFTRISGVPLIFFMPNFLVRSVCLYPMRLATQGTLDATDVVLKKDNPSNCAINLSGGYHHAAAHRGDGFCVYADIPLAVHEAITKYNINKALIIDLDAHQGDGYEEIFATQNVFKDKVYVFDVYNPHNFPQRPYLINDNSSWASDHKVVTPIKDDEYLKMLENRIPPIIEKQKPQLIIYNAGTDIYEKDPLGRMKITQEGIIERDEFIFQQAITKEIPLVMVLSGGYTAESAAIISKSIENIKQKFFTKEEK